MNRTSLLSKRGGSARIWGGRHEGLLNNTSGGHDEAQGLGLGPSSWDAESAKV